MAGELFESTVRIHVELQCLFRFYSFPAQLAHLKDKIMKDANKCNVRYSNIGLRLRMGVLNVSC